jgi:nitroreductase
MDALTALRTRRSIRHYEAKPVPRAMLETMVDCARLAATGCGEQPWEFVVVTEAETRRRLAESTGYGKFIAVAPACIVVLCRDTRFFLEDGSAATQNLLIAATAQGLGTCWIGGDKCDYAAAVAQIVGAPDGYTLISLVAVGFPAETPVRGKRPLAEVLHWERFSAE